MPYSRILALNKPEWLYVLLGVIAAAISGGVHPAFAVIFGKIIGVSFFTNRHCNPEIHSCSDSSLYARLGGIHLYKCRFPDTSKGVSDAQQHVERH